MERDSHSADSQINKVWMIPAVLLLLLAALVALTSPVLGWPAADPGEVTPAIYLPFIQLAPSSTWLQTNNRAESKAYYLSEYLPSNGVPLGWTGNYSSCSPGTTSAEFQDAVLRRINYFREMAGVPPLEGLNETYSQKAQAAALMMSVNKRLSHSPDSSWLCYSTDGREAAGSSNLQYGANGPQGISNYMADWGSNNSAAGHRRWILFPPTQYMGTGDVPAGGGNYAANALWVFDRFSPRPETRDPHVDWPPPGYVPYFLAYPRWSFSYPGADFGQATVTMSRDGQAIALQINPVHNGYGDNTIVWEPGVNTQQKPPADTTFAITITNVHIQGVPETFQYDVILFDPET